MNVKKARKVLNIAEYEVLVDSVKACCILWPASWYKSVKFQFSPTIKPTNPM